MDSYQTVDGIGQPSPTQELQGFVPLVVISQIFGLACVVVVAVWMGRFYGGFNWSTAEVFNYHPLFMVIGMVFLYADAILVYRIFRNNRKMTVKILHASLHIMALIFAIVGLRAVFVFHNRKTISNMYSLHSWLGLAAVILFCIQWVVGFLSFLFPKLSEDYRAKILKFHTASGLFLFGLSIGVSLLGINEKNFFDKNYSSYATGGIVGNVLGVLLVIFAAFILYIVSNRDYRRIEPFDDERILLKD